MKNFILPSGIILWILGVVMPAHAVSEDPAFFALSKLASIGIAPMSNIAVQTLLAFGRGNSQSAMATQGSRANIGRGIFSFR
jgi:hypothetical protein